MQGDRAGARPLLEEAIRRGRQSVKLDRKNRGFRVYLRNHYSVLASEILLPQGDLARAEEAAQEALSRAEELAAESPDVAAYQGFVAYILNTLGQVQRDAGQSEKAATAYRKAVAILEQIVAGTPSPRERQLLNSARLELSRVLMDTGEEVEAIGLCEKLLQANPGDTAAANNLALLLANGRNPSARKPAQAVELARGVARQMPKNPGVQATLGIAYYRLGDWEKAAAALEKACQLAGGTHATAGFFLAMTHWQRKNPEAARQWFDRASRRAAQFRPTVEATRARAEAAALLGIVERTLPKEKGVSPSKE
jgi:tetratricopeptide (TPR) repeat protein